MLAERFAVKTSKALTQRLLVVAVCVLPVLGGCAKLGDWTKTSMYRFLGPEKVIEPPEGSPINPILGSTGPADRSQEIIPNSEPPREGDWEYSDEEYVIGPTDIVDISILDLFAEGLETVLRRQVTNAGYIDMPLLTERLRVEGLTKEQLRDVVKAAYFPDVLREPTVSVTIAARRQNTFSILGSVARPGTYNILRRDMRLLEAVALAGGISQTNIRYVYVIRPKPAARRMTEGRPPQPTTMPGKGVILPPLPPEVPGPDGAKPTPTPATAPATQPIDPNAALRELGKALPGAMTAPPTPSTKPTTVPAPTPVPPPSVLALSEMGGPAGAAAPATKPAEDPALKDAAPRERWIYRAGKWVRAGAVPTETQPTTRDVPKRPDGRDPSDPFGWKKVDRSDMARVIAINLKQLRAGDPRMNIVIRDNDIVQVPTLEVGEFYVMGEVLRPGVYSLTGRQITVKMAVAAAGNMTQLAWPENSILIRRIGNFQEQVIPLDLEAIFQSRDPDVYLKPNDVIAVGTDVRSTFMAVMRNAFRMTYGFGFIYDRNFDDIRPITPTSRRFTRW